MVFLYWSENTELCWVFVYDAGSGGSENTELCWVFVYDAGSYEVHDIEVHLELTSCLRGRVVHSVKQIHHFGSKSQNAVRV